MLFALPDGPSTCIRWNEQMTSTGTISCFACSHTSRMELRTSYQSDFSSCRMISSLHMSFTRDSDRTDGVRSSSFGVTHPGTISRS